MSGSFNLVLNSSNNVGSNANTFQYNFIGGNFVVHEGMEICLAQATPSPTVFTISRLPKQLIFFGLLAGL